MDRIIILLTLVYIIFFGALVTSFSLLVGERLSVKDTIFGRSRCNECNHTLSFFHVIPIFGYICNFGKCRYCHAKIPFYYLVLEIFGGIIFSSFWYLISDFYHFSILTTSFSVFTILSVMDIKTRSLSDRVWFIGFIMIFFIRILQGNFLTFLLSSVIMFLLLLFLSLITEKVLKKEALGGGDIKLYLFIGMVLELPLAFLSLFFASVLGLLYAMIKKNKSDPYLPLVPFISLGVFIAYFWGQDLINWYLNILGM